MDTTIAKVQAVPLTKLQPAPWNPRSISDERFQNLCRSIETDPDFFGRRPILAQADGTIYAGNMRYRAAEYLGMKTVPAIVEDIPDRLARERALRDNAQWGEWEEDELASFIRTLGGEGSDLDLLGFEERDLQQPAPWNPRSISDERFQNLWRSIEADSEFLWRRPILAQADGTICAGR